MNQRRQDFVSLAHLARNAQIYDHLPQPLQWGLRRSIVFTALFGVCYLLFALLVPNHILLRGIPYTIFFVNADIVDFCNRFLRFLVIIEPVLVVGNSIGLVIVVLVSMMSHGMTRAVHEPAHWLALVASIPAMVSVASVGIVTVVLVMVTVALTIVWVIAVIIALQCGVPIGIWLGLGRWRRNPFRLF